MADESIDEDVYYVKLKLSYRAIVCRVIEYIILDDPHCMNSNRIRRFYGLHFPANRLRERSPNTDTFHAVPIEGRVLQKMLR